MMKTTLCVLAILTLALPATASANPCDTINDIANGWNNVANLAHENEGDGFTEEESAIVVDAVFKLTVVTSGLIAALNEGNEDTQAMADTLALHFAVLSELTETTAEAVVAIDGLVDTLDRVTDYCDAGQP